jgi:hypothetical protein
VFWQWLTRLRSCDDLKAEICNSTSVCAVLLLQDIENMSTPRISPDKVKALGLRSPVASPRGSLRSPGVAARDRQLSPSQKPGGKSFRRRLAPLTALMGRTNLP